MLGRWCPARLIRIGLRCVMMVALMAVLVAAGVESDVILLRNGNRIEGRIVNETPGEVVIQVGGIRQTIYRDRIAEIVRAAAVEASPAEQHANRARQHLDARNPEGAWQAVLEMTAADQSAPATHASVVRQAGRALHDQARAALARGDYERAESLARMFVGTAGVTAIQGAFTGNESDFGARTLSLLGEAQAARGQANYQQGNLQEAESNLREALENLGRDGAPAMRAMADLGLVLRNRGAALLNAGETAEAQRILMESIGLFSRVRDNSGSTAMIQNSRAEIDRIRAVLAEVQRGEQGAALSTPAVTIRPSDYAVEQNMGEATRREDYGVLGRIAGDDAGRWVFEQLRRAIPPDWQPRVITDWTIYILAFIFGFWIIPGKILAILAGRADPAAVQWRAWVTWIGPLALIGYIGSFIASIPKRRAAVKARHACPHCGFSLDDYFAYTNLNFSQCPNCGGEINPVHSLDEYIMFLANALATDVEKVQMGVVSMSRFVEKDTMQRLVRAMITLAVRRRASDIHVEPAQRHVEVRYRLDGIMVEMCKLPASLGSAVISAIKVQSNLDIAEKRKPQDGKMTIFVDGVDIDIRVATSPAHVGETATLRLLDVRTIQVETKKLGMSKTTRQVFERAIQEPHGLILVTGPTGSGKTTTLYVALRMIQTGDKNIISIEDPIEFTIPGINQIQINPTAGLTFATGLRSMLRQDPDVIMVGEIRDKETAEIAINAAQTGHLVFSTLHTIDSAAAISRLFDLGISPRQFADALSLIVAQRLIRLVCRECKQPHIPKPQLLEEIGLPADQAEELEYFIGKGCDICNHTGYHGRTGLYELLVPNGPIRTALEKGTLSTVELREVAVQNGMRTLREEALVLLKQGLTTPEEVLRVTK